MCFPPLFGINIDFLEETASGAVTSHRVNGIIIQQNIYGPHLEKVQPLIEKKKKQRSIVYEEKQLPIYNTGKKRRTRRENCSSPIPRSSSKIHSQRGFFLDTYTSHQ